jgi:hypothetical protein
MAGAAFDVKRISPARYQLGELGDTRFSEPKACRSSVDQFSELMACGLRRSTIAGAAFDGKRISPARYQLGKLSDNLNATH